MDPRVTTSACGLAYGNVISVFRRQRNEPKTACIIQHFSQSYLIFSRLKLCELV